MNRDKKFFSKIGANYLILRILTIIFQIIVFNAINPIYLNDVNIVSCLSSICNYILPFPILYWLMKKIKTVKLEKTGLGVKTFLLYIAVTMTLMWIGNIIGLMITMILSGAIQNDIANPVQQLINSADIWFNILIISIIGPVFEEILFRKFIIDRTIRYGARISIILSAVIFAFFHGNLNQFFYALLIGGFFAYVYIKTGKIIYTITLHSIINLIGSVASLIFTNSVTNIQMNFNLTDSLIIIIYMVFVFGCLLTGIYVLLTKFKKARFNGEKTEIGLKNPLKTLFLNYGMVLFILYFSIIMIRQVLG